MQTVMVMGNSKNLHVFNSAILRKSRKFDARELYMYYRIHEHGEIELQMVVDWKAM